jgi:hypothetical protein
MKLKGIPVKGVRPKKGGGLEKVQHYRDASHKIRALKNKKVRVGKRSPT